MAKNPCAKCCNTNPKGDPLHQLYKSPTMRLAECQSCARSALRAKATEKSKRVKLERLIMKAHKLNSMYDPGLRNEAIRLMTLDVIATGGCEYCLGKGQVYDGHDPDDGWAKCPKCNGTGIAAARIKAAK